MTALVRPFRYLGPSLLAIVALAGVARGQVARLEVRNDLQTPVIVTIVADQPAARAKPYPFYPGEVYWEPVLQPGKRQVTVYDPRTRRPVFHTTINATGTQSYSLRWDPNGQQIMLVPRAVRVPKTPDRRK
jgi:hypothetical protein